MKTQISRTERRSLKDRSLGLANLLECANGVDEKTIQKIKVEIKDITIPEKIIATIFTSDLACYDATYEAF